MEEGRGTEDRTVQQIAGATRGREVDKDKEDNDDGIDVKEDKEEEDPVFFKALFVVPPPPPFNVTPESPNVKTMLGCDLPNCTTAQLKGVPPFVLVWSLSKRSRFRTLISSSKMERALCSNFSVAVEKLDRTSRRARGEGGKDMGVYITTRGLPRCMVGLVCFGALFVGDFFNGEILLNNDEDRVARVA